MKKRSKDCSLVKVSTSLPLYYIHACTYSWIIDGVDGQTTANAVNAGSIKAQAAGGQPQNPNATGSDIAPQPLRSFEINKIKMNSKLFCHN